MDPREQRRRNPERQVLRERGLYHSFELPDGRQLSGMMSLDYLRRRLDSFGLPASLAGLRVLDIGPWDGFYTFEMERRGAQVTALDYADLDTFRLLHRAFGSRAEYVRMDAAEISAARLGTFDIVLCLGVLYHLRHPLDVLEKICSVTRDVCIVDTFTTDGREWLAGQRQPIPTAEFYETSELGGQIDNWWGPSVEAVAAWIRAAGFAEAELMRVEESSVCYAARRHWKTLPACAEPAVAVRGVHHHQNRGISFCSRKEEYPEIWAEWRDSPPDRQSVFPLVDDYGVPPLYCLPAGEALHIAVRLPPGLAPGPHTVRLKIGARAWSEPVPFFLDLPPLSGAIEIGPVQDGVTWQVGQVEWPRGGWLTVWAAGLSEEADPGNTVVHIGGVPHFPESVTPATGQINVRLRPVLPAGQYEVTVVHREVRSNACPLTVAGSPPPVHGLESLWADVPVD